MKVTMVSPFHIPTDSGAGVAMVNWAVLRALTERQHDVTVLSLVKEVPTEITPELKAIMDLHAVAGVAPLGMTSEQLEPNIRHNNPDVLYIYTPTGLWQTQTIKDIPKLAAIVDLDHMVEPYRRQYVFRDVPMTYGEFSQTHAKASQHKDRQFLPLVRQPDILVEHAKHHADWLNDEMKIPTRYVPMPVVDPAFPGWRRSARQWPENPKPKIVLAGHLHGIATMSGLYFFAEDVLPHLDVEKYDINICGAETLPPALATRFKPYPSIKFRGFVHDIKKEMLTADVFLCPTPIDLGFRTRLVETMALSCPIVAHGANGLGMPEAVNGENILFAYTGEQMAEAIRIVCEEKEEAHRMGLNARATYEEHFMNSAFTIVDMLEELHG